MMTGTISPARSRVASLNCAQNCGMLTLADAKAGPGRAPPAGNWSLTTFAIFLLTRHSSFFEMLAAVKMDECHPPTDLPIGLIIISSKIIEVNS